MRRGKTILIALAICFGLGGVLSWRYLIREPDYPRHPFGDRYDPIEDDPKIQPFLLAAEKEAIEEEKGKGSSHLGGARSLMHRKKQILKEKYGINWRTPAELNPDFAFD